MRYALALGVILLAQPAWSSDALQRARQAYEDMEYDAALAAAAEALAGPQAQPGELVESYRVRGLSLSALERLDEALEAFRAMLSIDPRATISADTSPKLAAPFFQALAMSRDLKPIALSHDAPAAEGRPASLTVRLISDPQALVKAMRLVHRAPQGAWKRASAQRLRGKAEAAYPPPPGEAVEYYFEALTEAGGVLARAGGPESPFAFRAPAPRPEVAAVPPAGREDPPPAVSGLGEAGGDLREEEPGAVAPWYETWWFWTAVGVVVVGSALGAGLGVGLSADGGGPRDYVIEVR